MTQVAAERAASAASTPARHAPPPALSSSSHSPPPPHLSSRPSPSAADVPERCVAHALVSDVLAASTNAAGHELNGEHSARSPAPPSPTTVDVLDHQPQDDKPQPDDKPQQHEPQSAEREERQVTPQAQASPSVHGDEHPSDQPDAAASHSSFDDPFAHMDVVSTMDLFDVSNYTFGIKNDQSRSKLMSSSTSKSDLYHHLRTTYNKRGIRRSVGAVILVHNHRFPHILLLQRKDGRGEYVLPGGRLRPGESNEDGLQRKLVSKLTPLDVAAQQHDDLDDHATRPDVGEKLCSWYAIDFDRRYFPYVPAHVTKPKEELHIYAVSLPSTFTFAVPNNLQLLAVPIFDVFNNSATYGDVISSIPSVLSKYHFNYC